MEIQETRMFATMEASSAGARRQGDFADVLRDYLPSKDVPTHGRSEILERSAGVLESGRRPSSWDDPSWFDTDKGRMRIDLDAYFAPNPSSLAKDLPPLLLPSEENLQALADHLEGSFKVFLESHGIPTAPSIVSYDTSGRIQLPDDYAYSASLRKALDEDPAMARELSTVNAMASHAIELRRAIAFQREYLAATTRQQLEAILAKYRDLLSGTRPPDDVALVFSPSGELTTTINGMPLNLVPGA